MIAALQMKRPASTYATAKAGLTTTTTGAIVMADHSLCQIQARITTASIVLALQRARNAVKEELKRQRRRLADVEAKEITALAREYLDVGR